MALNWEEYRRRLLAAARPHTTHFFGERVFAPENPAAVCLTAAWDQLGRVQVIPAEFGYVVRAHRPNDMDLGGKLFVEAAQATHAQARGAEAVADPIVAAVQHVLGKNQ